MNSLLTLLDDIAATMDDVAVMTKVAIKKTSTLMSDDLAVNAGVINGVGANRELPIVWKIFVGSLVNKVIAIGGILLLHYLYPPLINHLLLLGGLYLCYEGAHKVVEKISNKNNEAKKESKTESARIKGAIITDLVLSFEIITMAKSEVTGDFLSIILTLSLVGLAASVLIYGLVAIIIKIDDFGVLLVEKGNTKSGQFFINSMPYIMKGLAIIGTVAMFLVGGSLIGHYFHLNYILPIIIQDLGLGIIGGGLTIFLTFLPKKILAK